MENLHKEISWTKRQISIDWYCGLDAIERKYLSGG
jgi:hypothetical protein